MEALLKHVLRCILEVRITVPLNLLLLHDLAHSRVDLILVDLAPVSHVVGGDKFGQNLVVEVVVAELIQTLLIVVVVN